MRENVSKKRQKQKKLFAVIESKPVSKKRKRNTTEKKLIAVSLSMTSYNKLRKSQYRRNKMK